MSKARSKGTQYENHLRDQYLTGVWPQADRAPLRGTQDRGDFDGTPLVIEAKKRNAWALPAWIRTTRAKAERVGRPWMILFAGDKRTDMSEDLVVMPTRQLFNLLSNFHDVRAGSGLWRDWDTEMFDSMEDD